MYLTFSIQFSTFQSNSTWSIKMEALPESALSKVVGKILCCECGTPIGKFLIMYNHTMRIE